jgi:hypothetical protein
MLNHGITDSNGVRQKLDEEKTEEVAAMIRQTLNGY